MFARAAREFAEKKLAETEADVTELRARLAAAHALIGEWRSVLESAHELLGWAGEGGDLTQLDYSPNPATEMCGVVARALEARLP